MVEFVVMGLAAVFATIIVLAGSARPARGDGGPELPIPAAPTGRCRRGGGWDLGWRSLRGAQPC